MTDRLADGMRSWLVVKSCICYCLVLACLLPSRGTISSPIKVHPRNSVEEFNIILNDDSGLIYYRHQLMAIFNLYGKDFKFCSYSLNNGDHSHLSGLIRRVIFSLGGGSSTKICGRARRECGTPKPPNKFLTGLGP